MYKAIKTIVFTTFVLALIFACNNTQKVKSSDYKSLNETSKKVIENNALSLNEDVHTVVVLEVILTEKYTYLKVSENTKQYWIATISKDVVVGNEYIFKGGMLQTNFESKDLKRVFDRIYLVSNLVTINHGTSANSGQNDPKNKNTPIQTEKIVAYTGSIKIAEIVNNTQKYSGKSVQITGVCTKINTGIMDRNWIHLIDGSKDDYDLVITSDVFVPEGKVVTMKADVSLNKDFGAGYTYSIILENGVLIK